MGSPKVKYEFSGFASIAEHHTQGTKDRHTKFWLGNIMGRLFNTKHKNNVTFILGTLLRQQSIKTVQAVQHRFIRISQRCSYISPMIQCSPQTWNFFQKVTESYHFLFSFPFKWHSYLAFTSLNILHGFPYDLQSVHRLGTSQIHYFSNSLKRSPRCRKGSNTTAYRRTYLILQILCFPYAKLLTYHKGEKHAYEITMPRTHACYVLNLQITRMIFTHFGVEVILRSQGKVLFLTSHTRYYQYGGRRNVSGWSDT